MVELLDLPPECLFGIFRETSHRDLARLQQACKVLNETISKDHLLYKLMYMDRWDEPAPGAEIKGEQWRLVGERFAHMIHVLEKASPSENESDDKPDMLPIAESILDFLKASNSKGGTDSRNADILAVLFKNEANLDMFLGNSSTFNRSREASNQRSQRSLRSSQVAVNELSAKIHCLYGTPLYDDWYQEHQVYPYACSRTYDLRNYRTENLWGPFKDDGSLEADWEKLESSMIILGWNVKRYRDGISRALPHLWRKPFDGAWANSYRVEPANDQRMHLVRPFPRWAGLDEGPVSGDPYGLTGTWMRIVCFLDYHDLFRFNFGPQQPPHNQPRPPINIQEATRIITMQIVATKIDPPGEEDHPDMPVVHFKGTSRATHHSWDINANSIIRGVVRMTKEGEVRWTSYSVYYGEERWKSEGIQVGGIRSGRGVFGHWFDRNYDPQGSAGPTAFWKISDDYDCNCEDHKGTKRGHSSDEESESEEDDLDTTSP